MRTTIRIDDRLLAEAKARAAESGRTVAAVIDDALREAFTRRATADSPARRTLPVFRASRLARNTGSVRLAGLSAVARRAKASRRASSITAATVRPDSAARALASARSRSSILIVVLMHQSISHVHLDVNCGRMTLTGTDGRPGGPSFRSGAWSPRGPPQCPGSCPGWPPADAVHGAGFATRGLMRDPAGGRNLVGR